MCESLFNFFDVEQNIVTKLEMLGQEDKAIEKFKTATKKAKKKSIIVLKHSPKVNITRIGKL